MNYSQHCSPAAKPVLGQGVGALPTYVELIIQQGATFQLPVRWESTPFVATRITSIENTNPARITTAEPHGIPPGWSVAVVGARGLAQLNAKENPPRTFRRATVKSSTVIELNGFSAAMFGAHVAGSGYLQWYSPHDLAGYEASMDIRDPVDGSLILNLSTANERIEIDDGEKKIMLLIEAEATESLAVGRPYVCDLEMVSPTGIITTILAGSVEVRPGITTTPT